MSRRKSHRPEDGSYRSLDFKTYQSAVENEKPRVLRGANAKIQTSSEYLDRIEAIHAQEPRSGL